MIGAAPGAQTHDVPVSGVGKGGRPAGPLHINGRFLAVQPTGVHRVARQLVGEMERHVEELRTLFVGQPDILAPRNTGPSRYGGALLLRSRSMLTGQAWEQLELPARARGGLLLSFCNLAPIATRRAITMIHDAQTFAAPESYSSAFGTFYRAVQPIIGRRHLRILTVSDFSARELVRYGVAPADRIRVIRNGVDHVARRTPDPAILARLGLAGGGYVLALSSTQAHKNIRVLLRAFADPALASLRLVLFGATTPAELAAAGFVLPANVVHAGRVSDEELSALMAEALCFAMPSTTEGFGLPPLEAMAQGCPAVVAPCGALPEVCGNAALYARPDRPDEWVAAISALAGHAETRARHVGLSRRQAARMTWQRAGDALMAVLREVVEEGRQ